MKIKINGEGYEVRVQQRTITEATIMKSGEVVGVGAAWLNPNAENDEDVGAKIAIGRALQELKVIDPGLKNSIKNLRPLDQSERKEILGQISKRIEDLWIRSINATLKRLQDAQHEKYQAHLKERLESVLRPVGGYSGQWSAQTSHSSQIRSRFVSLLGLSDEG